MRPHKYPTLELRATPAPTVGAPGALSLPSSVDQRRLDPVDRAIAVENKWRAQRYGVDATLASWTGATSVRQMLGDTLDRVGPDADALNCSGDVNHCRMIVSSGSSADAHNWHLRPTGSTAQRLDAVFAPDRGGNDP